jgi:hypothetical protein
MPVRIDPEDVRKFPAQVQAAVAAAGVVGGTVKGTPEQDIRIGQPKPTIRLSADQAMDTAVRVAGQRMRQLKPMAALLRTVPTACDLHPIGGAATGAWAYTVRGYERTWTARWWWEVDVDAVTGQVLGFRQVRR